MVLRHIWTFISGLICLYVQLLVMPAFELFGVIPNLLLPWIVYLVWTREINPVLVVVFIIGLLYDTTQPQSFGFYALVFVLVALGVDQFRRPFEAESVVARLLTLLAANFIFHLVGFLVLGAVYEFNSELLGLAGIAFVYDLAISFVVFWGMQYLSKLRLTVKRD